MFWVVVGVVAAVLLLPAIYWFFTPLRQSWNDPPPLTYKHKFLNPSKGEETEFPSIFDAPSVYMSLIVPAYNEENRMHAMMAETLPYLQKRAREDSSFTYEIIIVDDGSRDATDHIALEYVSRYGTDAIRLLKLVKNQGKGGAVQQGMLHARGELLLMVDADGATEISELGKLEKAVKECMTKDGHGLAVGSRAHLEDAAIAERKWYRNILMHGFHFLVSCLCVRGIRDTQCGFKLFARNTARLLFANQHVRRWCFDVELLHIAQRKGVPMREVGVRWQEIPGSKLALLESSVLMGRDLVVIRFCYMFGFWKVQDVKTLQKQA